MTASAYSSSVRERLLIPRRPVAGNNERADMNTNDVHVQSQKQGAGAAMGEVRREKFWSELTADEKIERMHGVVRDQQRTIERMGAQLNALNMHQHGPRGDLLVPMGAGRTEGLSGYRRDADWF